jgi:hypothetical protein
MGPLLLGHGLLINLLVPTLPPSHLCESASSVGNTLPLKGGVGGGVRRASLLADETVGSTESRPTE